MLYRGQGRLRWHLNLKLPRHSYVRWVGRDIGWVVSGVQVALWTDCRNRRGPHRAGLPYNWRFNWCPLPRSY